MTGGAMTAPVMHRRSLGSRQLKWRSMVADRADQTISKAVLLSCMSDRPWLPNCLAFDRHAVAHVPTGTLVTFSPTTSVWATCDQDVSRSVIRM